MLCFRHELFVGVSNSLTLLSYSNTIRNDLALSKVGKRIFLTVTYQRQRKTKDPCPGCFLHQSLCLCSEIPKLQLRTRICLVIHRKELKRTTNTGQLALRALPNSEMKVRGTIDDQLDLTSALDPNYFPLLFYPSENAIELTPDYIAKIHKPILLIVPDGNWRQASKVNTRHPELKNIPRVMIRAKNLEDQHLRQESTDYGMATLQAIAYALGATDGEFVQNELLKLYHLKLQRTLIGRGQC